MNTTDLINRAQSDLNEYGAVTAKDAQALIDALIAATGDKVFVCNDAPVFQGAQVFAAKNTK